NVLGRMTKMDLSSAAFPYMAMREGDIAGVACRVFRIGFVGELGYEIHWPSSHAPPVWESLMESGRDAGIRPLGLEGQRILRLGKGHFIVGVDPDALSTALDAGLDGMVRFDNPEFHGREPLLRLKAMPPRSRLVGFRMLEGDMMPEEGCQVVEHG